VLQGGTGTTTPAIVAGTNVTVSGTWPNQTINASGGGSPTFPVNPQTATYQVLAADFSACKSIEVASGTFTATLVASGSQPSNGQCVWIVNYGSGVVTIARSGQNINGAAANLTLAAGSASAPTSALVVSDGTNYFAQLFGVAGGASVSSFSGDGALLNNSASTGGVTASLANAAAHKYWGNPTGSTTAPAYSSIVAADLPSNVRVRSIGAGFVNGGSALVAGATTYFTVPYACTVAAWNITVDTGTATIDVWKIASGTAIPTITNTITASALPAISTGTAIHSTTLTGWTTSVTANDIFGINLKTVASATQATLNLECDQ